MDAKTAAGDTSNLTMRIDSLDRTILQNPFKDYRRESVTLAKDVYSNILDHLDAKAAQGVPLADEERGIQAMCRDQLNKDPPAQTLFDNLHWVMMKMGEMVRAVADFFCPSKEKNEISMLLLTASENAVPGSLSFLANVIVALEYLFTPSMMPMIANIAAAQMLAANSYQTKTSTVDKEAARDMLTFAGFAYDGFSSDKSRGYRSMSGSEIPGRLRGAYNESTGIFEVGGLRVWLGRKSDELVVAFSGTDVTNPEMLFADLEQLCFANTLYMKAVGLLYMIIGEHPDAKRIHVTGHSLGGGLATFATCACKRFFDNIDGFAFNPAGLSLATLMTVEDSWIDRAKHSIQVFMTPYDPVSLVGAKIGYLVTLPLSQHNGHGIRDVGECLDAYGGRTLADAGDTLAVSGMTYRSMEMAPYINYVSLKADASGEYWNCFNSTCPAGEMGVFARSTVSRPILMDLAPPSGIFPAGVFQFFNGTSHTALNRMLILSRGGAVTSKDSPDDTYSTVIYGYYGFGRMQFMSMLQKAYVSSREAYRSDRSDLERALAFLYDPCDAEIRAWLRFFEYDMGVAGITRYAETYPAAMEKGRRWLLQYSSARENLFAIHFKNRAPDAAERKAFVTDLKRLASKHVDLMLNEAVRYSVITSEKRDSVRSEFLRICDGL